MSIFSRFDFCFILCCDPVLLLFLLLIEFITMATDKRKRSANWMASEKTLLVDLVTEHFHVIENKRTDGVSMKQKLAEWTTISHKYNSQTMLSHRTVENLKARWESLKKATKKEASFKRMHLIQTGGGPSRPKNDDPLQERILGLITPSAVGLHNPYDKDNINITENITESFPGEAHKNDIGTIPGPEVQTKHSSESAAPFPAPTGIEYDLLNENEFPVPTLDRESPHPQVQIMTSNKVDTNETMNEVDWGDYTPKSLKTPVSLQLRPTEEKRRPVNSGKRLEWMSKRRPQLSRASQETLQKLKGKAINIQMEHAANEREEAKQLFEIQMDIQKENLKQEKIKTKLLLLELEKMNENK